MDRDPAHFDWGQKLAGIYGLDPAYHLASSWQWNVAVEREVFEGIRLELGYQGNRSTDQPTGVPTNLAVFAPGADDSASSVLQRRPNPLFADSLYSVENKGRTRYDQLLLVTRVRRGGLFGQLSYAYTHTRRNFNGNFAGANYDFNSGITFPGAPTLTLDTQNNHTIAGFLVWHLPILRNDETALGKVLGGWSVAGNGYWSFLNKGGTVYLGYDGNADGYGPDLADLVSPVSYPKTPLQGQGDLLYQWFDPSAFAYPGGATSKVFSPAVTYAAANVLDTLPSSWGVDASLMKSFALHGDARLQLRFECYNVFNHANLNWPVAVFTDLNFGKIKGKYGDGRRIQLGMRLQF